MGHPTLADVKAEIAKSERALVVVGTGVSLAAMEGTASAGLASWEGLLRHGIEHCTRFGGRDEAWAAALRPRLEPPETEALLAVAGEVCGALAAPGLGELGRWLQDTVGSFRAVHRDELRALRDLGLPLATTNYDGLLEEATGLPAATWQDTSVIEDLVRGKPPRAILHLHGYWERPDSVILDPGAYRRAEPMVQELLRALRLSHTLLFVGCGGGLADPNWSSLLRWSREILAASRYRHFRLCRTAELPDLERQHPRDERLFPVAYGAGFGDLAPFLRQLQPPAIPSALPLPVAASCFGREEPIEALVAALCAIPPRPAAVLGPPGVGKTTVTLEALHEPRVVARFAGRRYFVRCAAATSRDSLLNSIGLSLRLDLSPIGQATDLETRIVSDLAAAPAVLVLDNAETPWESDAGGFEDLLSRLTALPELAVAASLRGAERPIGPAWRETIALDLLAPVPAREAFLAIAGEAHRSDPLLEPLLASVGHLPLALVLLAAQAEGVPLSNLWYRWHQEKSRLLRRAGGGTRATSLEVSISLSLDSPRLTPEARELAALLARLPDGMAAEDLRALEQEHGEASSARLRKVGLALPLDPRLRLYSPIREALASTLPPAAEARERLLGHYLDLAKLGERAGAEGGSAAFERLAPELGNLEALMTPALEGPTPERAINAVLALLELARFSGIQQSGLFERALAAARRAGSPESLASFLLSLGDLSQARSDHDGARARYEEALPLFCRVGSVLGEAKCVKRLGAIAVRRSDHDTARSRYEEAFRLYRRVGSVLGEADCVSGLGDIARERFDYDTARARYEEALSLFRGAGAVLGVASCVRMLGNIALARSDHDGARALYEEALPLFRRVGSVLGEAGCIESLGNIAIERLDDDGARAHYEEALPLYRRVGSLLGEANCIHSLGNIALQRSDNDGASARYEEALCLYRRVGSFLGEAQCIRDLGDIALQRFDHDGARACYEEALSLHRRIGDVLGEANCIRSLGDIALGISDEAGAVRLFEQALDLYGRLPEPRSMGLAHWRLARLARGERRDEHLHAARAAWQAIQRPDMIADLDREFPPARQGAEFGDLAPFLRQLRPPAIASALPLPVAASCFGREEPIEALAAALCAIPPGPAAVLGPPGVGKTTVTLVALYEPRVVARFAGRRYFVRCAAATSRDSLLNAIALSLRLDLSPTGQATDLETRIVSHLAGAPALLVLDNAETPWEADGGGFEDVLSRLTALPELALAASLRGAERPIGSAWRAAISLDLLAPAPARETFLAIAGEAHRSDPLLEALLASVGHLPLALVLLAAQAEGVPLSNLWHRWQREKSRLLRRAGGGTPATSLEVSISLSLDSPRLTPEARGLAALLALLPDGMAAEDLRAIEPEHGEASSARLRKVGLALPLDPRLRLYSPIREVLASTVPPAAEVRERVLGHYLDLAELGVRAGAEGGSAAFERLAPELGNLEALITPALEGPTPERAISAVLALLELARFSGIQQSGLFERALAAARRAGSPQSLAWCLSSLGDLSLARSDHDGARARYEEALPLFRRDDDLQGEAHCIRILGDIALQRFDHDGARAHYEEALPLFRRDDDLQGEAHCIRSLGDIALQRFDHDGARARYEEALVLYRRVGGVLGEANCIMGLGAIALRRSDHDGARARYEEALSLCHRIGDVHGAADCIKSLGDIAHERSDHDGARARYEEAFPLYRRVGDILGEANCFSRLGAIAFQRSDHDGARVRNDEALRLYRRVGNVLGEANCIQRLGDMALGIPDEAGAVRLFEQALDLYGRLPEPCSMGLAHWRLARLARGERRDQHLKAARAAWQAIQRPDLIANLDHEFPPARQGRSPLVSAFLRLFHLRPRPTGANRRG
jgi:tetratricopeptide (TPR) repeat protein